MPRGPQCLPAAREKARRFEWPCIAGATPCRDRTPSRKPPFGNRPTASGGQFSPMAAFRRSAYRLDSAARFEPPVISATLSSGRQFMNGRVFRNSQVQPYIPSSAIERLRSVSVFSRTASSRYCLQESSARLSQCSRSVVFRSAVPTQPSCSCARAQASPKTEKRPLT